MNTTGRLEHLRNERKLRKPLVCGGVGSGITARGAVEGGAQLLSVYNTAIYRIMGLPTALAFLPYDDANEITFQTLPQIIAGAGSIPVLVGVGAHDPRLDIDHMLTRIASAGGAGVTNEPFVGIYSEDIRRQLESAGFGFRREVDLVRAGVQRGLLTMGWAFDVEQAVAMAEAKAHLLAVNLGLTVFAEDNPATLDSALRRLSVIVTAAREIAPDLLILIHGGPFNRPEPVAAAYAAIAVDGYVTGSTVETAPVRSAVAEAVRRFGRLSV